MATVETRLRGNAIGLIGAATLGAVMMAPALSIYFNYGPIARQAGKTVPLVYVIAMVASLPTALSYALVSRELPSAGSAYTWLWQAMSRWVGVWLGLVLAAYYLIAVIIQPLAFGLFFNDALRLAGVSATGYVTWMLGVLVATGLVGFVTYRGITASTRTSVVFLVVETLVVAALAVSVLLSYRGTGHALDFAAFDPRSCPTGRAGIFAGLIFGILTFVGYDVICTVAEETKTPRRLIPTATLLALLGPGLFAILASWALVSAVPMTDILAHIEAQQTPITPIAEETWGYWKVIVILTGLSSALGVYVAAAVGCGRVLYAMGRDRTLPAWFGRLHPRFQAPWNAHHLVFAATVVGAAVFGAWVGPLNAYLWWGSAIVLFGLTTYVLVNAANFLFFYRFRRRQFHWFLNGLLPGLGILLNGYLLYESFFVGLAGAGWKMGSSIVVTGLGLMVLAAGYTLWLRKWGLATQWEARVRPSGSPVPAASAEAQAAPVVPAKPVSVVPGLSSTRGRVVSVLALCLVAGAAVPAVAGVPAPEGIYIVPQSHVDLAWFWRWEPETIEIVIPSTFGTAVRNLLEFPDYSFSASQVPLFEGLRQHHRELASQVEQLIRQGRFEIVGGHWLEFEGCGPGGEAIVRHCVYGKRYFKQTYGVELCQAWQPDAWTHPATLPQILKKCGMDTYVFQRGAPGENIFWWESADGSRVLAYRPFHAGSPDLSRVVPYHNEIRAKYGINISMWRAGRGDHGGSWSREDIERVRDQMRASEIPARFSRVDTFLSALKTQDKDWPVWRSELGFELEGCHANGARLKAANRLCENLLIEAEKFSAIAARVAGLAYPQGPLKGAWLDVLMNQFHDTIGGCVVPAGYEDALELYARAERSARQCRDEALGRLCDGIDTRGEGVPVVVFNSLSWARSGPVELSIRSSVKPEHLSFAQSGGELVPGQIIATQERQGHWETRCVFVARDVPSMGYRTYHARVGGQLATQPAGSALGAQDWRVESDRFAIRVDRQTGDLARVFDKQRRLEVLPQGAPGNQIQILEETGDSEGRLRWGEGRWSPDALHELNGWTVVEAGPVRTTVRIRNTWSKFHVGFDRFVTLYADLPCVYFRTHIEWNGTGKMVKLAFPTAYRGARPTYDIPYGTIAREASGKERPALQWVDLSDEQAGVSLLNDCRCGHDVQDGVIRIDALRSPIAPVTNTEAGNQELTYALYPHAGDWRAGQVMRMGYEFNNPLVGVATEPHEGRVPQSGTFLGVDRPNVILSVVKQAEDAACIIVRGYEIFGDACSVHVELAGLNVARATVTNMLEQSLSALPAEPGPSQSVRVNVPVGAYEVFTVRLD